MFQQVVELLLPGGAACSNPDEGAELQLQSCWSLQVFVPVLASSAVGDHFPDGLGFPFSPVLNENQNVQARRRGMCEEHMLFWQQQRMRTERGKSGWSWTTSQSSFWVVGA